jgi:hypothetical protein
MADRASIISQAFPVVPGALNDRGDPLPVKARIGIANSPWIGTRKAEEIRAAWAEHPEALVLFRVQDDGYERRFLYDGHSIRPAVERFAMSRRGS